MLFMLLQLKARGMSSEMVCQYSSGRVESNGDRCSMRIEVIVEADEFGDWPQSLALLAHSNGIISASYYVLRS